MRSLKLPRFPAPAFTLVPGNHDWYATEVDSQALYIEQFGRETQYQGLFSNPVKARRVDRCHSRVDFAWGEHRVC